MSDYCCLINPSGKQPEIRVGSGEQQWGFLLSKWGVSGVGEKTGETREGSGQQWGSLLSGCVCRRGAKKPEIRVGRAKLKVCRTTVFVFDAKVLFSFEGDRFLFRRTNDSDRNCFSRGTVCSLSFFSLERERRKREREISRGGRRQVEVQRGSCKQAEAADLDLPSNESTRKLSLTE